MIAARALTRYERHRRDLDDEAWRFAAEIIGDAQLGADHEAEIRRATAAALRHVIDLTLAVTVAEAALNREQAAANHHVEACSRCRWFKARFCRGLWQIRRQIDRLHHAYRAALKPLERAS